MDTQPKLKFATKAKTKIWYEQSSKHNPYLAQQCRLHGYDLFELIKNKSFVDVVFLLFTGELPNKAQAQLLEQIMIALINPGPRHAAGRAAMVTGICKARAVHILPVSLMVLGGDHLGSGEVESSMNFFQENKQRNPEQLAQTLLSKQKKPNQGDWHIVPGIGSRYGDIDPMPNQLAEHLASFDIAETIRWGNQFIQPLMLHHIAWLSTGIAAAALLDLGINPREGSGLFQLLCAPGLLAHGMEQTHHPITDMPFVEDEDYVIE